MPAIKNPAIRERNSQRIFGCSEAVALELNNNKPLRDPSGWAARYCSQRQSSAKRGICWEISFPEWMAIWKESGLMEQRGVGRSGFCMARHGDEGPYRVGNVSIKSCIENSREGLKKTYALGRISRDQHIKARAGKGRGWTKRENGPRPYQVFFGKKYIGVFATEGQARAAYLAACEVHLGSPSLKS